MSASEWIQLLLAGMTSGAIYGLIGLGYVTIYRTSRVVNFAQGSFVMLGALIAYSLLNEFSMSYWEASIGSVVIVVLISLVMYRLVIVPLIEVSLVAMILGTIGVSLILENIALIIWGGYGQSVPELTPGTLAVGGIVIPKQSLWIVGLTAVILLGLYLLANHTFLGKKMTATALNPGAAGACGVYTNRMVLVAFAISAAIAAFSGIAISSITPVNYLSGGVFGLTGFVAAILGGWGSSAGAVVGGLALGFFEAVAIGLLPAGYKGAVAFVLLLLLLYVRPSGILGRSALEGES